MDKEKAILIGVNTDNETLDHFQESLKELKDLAITAGADVVDTICIDGKGINPKFFIGKGKVGEIKSLYSSKIRLVIFNNELTPTQIRNLEKELNLKVITRTELIMDIFAIHAKSKTARLQVELAQLSYELPRITGKGTMLSRLGGGIGTRGPGEQKLEIDRRLIKRRIYLIKKKLKEIEIGKAEQRKSRSSHEFKVAIVGYTNSGKSSLLRSLTKADVVIEDRLFATLDTTTRRLWLGFINNLPVNIVITDTVGFIRDLPHGLIESFKSTLQDTLDADLLIHLIDITSLNFLEKKEIVEKTLFEIGATNIPILNCFNKIDILSEKELLNYRLLYPNYIFISAVQKRNMEVLKNKIKNYYLKHQLAKIHKE